MRQPERWFAVVVCAVGFAACDFPRPPDIQGPSIDAATGDAPASDTPRCGNGVMDPGEECDDGNLSDADDCTTACKKASCGDGFTRSAPEDPANREECDDPTLPTECSYSATKTACMVCNASCKLVAGIPLFCGDGVIQAPEEVCDGGDRGCGACSSNCQTAIAEQATGLIVAASGSAFTAGDYFTLSDGVLSLTFEYTKTGTVGPNRQPIPISDDDNTAAVIIRTADAILDSQLRIIPDHLVGGTAHLRHERLTTIGNVAIEEHVMTSDFAVEGMSGGLGGQCLEGQPCKSLIECASNICDVTGKCAEP